MNKTSTAGVTLVAAVPAAVLAISLVGTFLTHLGDMSGMFRALAALTLLACAGVIFIPFAILVFGARAPKAAKVVVPAAPKGGKKAAAVEEVEEFEEEEGLNVDLDDQSLDGSTGELDVVEGGMTVDDLDVVDDQFSEADMTAFPEEDFDFTEEPKPPKKKKKK